MRIKTWEKIGFGIIVILAVAVVIIAYQEYRKRTSFEENSESWEYQISSTPTVPIIPRHYYV